MDPHVERMIEEAEQLDGRIDRLVAFFETKTFAGLGGQEQLRMRAQAEYMRRYSQVLHDRINAALGEQIPLRCEARDCAINIAIGQEVLKFAAEQHPLFWDGESAPDVPNIVITDAAIFAKEVVAEIDREREDGSTLLTDFLDEAIKRAVENGCEGVDHDDNS